MGLASFNRMRRLQADKKVGESNAERKTEQGNTKGQTPQKKQIKKKEEK